MAGVSGPRSREAEVSEAELRSYLRERLPEYMVPQVLVKLERMPLSRHGKIDYQRLAGSGAAGR